MTQNPTTIAQNYRRLIEGVIEETCLRRITEIEGRAPTVAEVLRHSSTHLADKKGDNRVLFLWKDSGICQFTPATYTLEGWRDAVICELRPAREVVDEMKTLNGVRAHIEDATR